ncbi:HP0495 family protein [Desulfogranum japonicum]|uniref:HP0495 family protein n=1 Tax=Desulfogranum japonicum TaxID=231447 RepID=UPI000402B7FC|nr:DUF493 domain-containing protein [Desulfogranum japonicum]
MKKILSNQTCDCKPEIEYPTAWQYKIIGYSREAIEEAVFTAVKGASFLLTHSNTSSGGKYISMNLELVVETESHRLSLYDELVQHPDVKVVL